MDFVDNNNKLFLLEQIVRKDFASKYKDSFLGILWSVIKPLATMIILTIIFSTIFAHSIPNYPVYFLAGKCVFEFFKQGTTAAMNSLVRYKTILKRINAPKAMFVLGNVISEFINFLISLGILFAVMIATGAPFYFSVMPVAIITIISAILMVIGFGLILSILAIYYTDVEHLYGVITFMLMYACALFYPIEIVPEPYQSYMLLNPVYWLVDQFRQMMFMGVIPDTLNLVNSFLFSLIIFIIGIIVFKKYEQKISMRF